MIDGKNGMATSCGGAHNIGTTGRIRSQLGMEDRVRQQREHPDAGHDCRAAKVLACMAGSTPHVVSPPETADDQCRTKDHDAQTDRLARSQPKKVPVLSITRVQASIQGMPA